MAALNHGRDLNGRRLRCNPVPLSRGVDKYETIKVKEPPAKESCDGQ